MRALQPGLAPVERRDAAPVVAVIVPVHNADDTLATQLEALCRQRFDFPWELIVANNRCSDRSMEVARGFADRLPLRIVDAHEVRGAAHTRNVGARAARAPLLAFVDADDEVDPGWLAAIVAALDVHPAVASRFGKERLNVPALWNTRRIPQAVGLSAHNYASFMPHAGGSGLAVRRTVHEAIGGFDERLLRLEDTDYCWRLQLAGHELHFEPRALVHIRFRTRPFASLRQSFDYGRYDGWLYQRYRSEGMERVPLARDLRRIGFLAARLLSARDERTRSGHLRELANRAGIVLGRLRHPWARR